MGNCEPIPLSLALYMIPRWPILWFMRWLRRLVPPNYVDSIRFLFVGLPVGARSSLFLGERRVVFLVGRARGAAAPGVPKTEIVVAKDYLRALFLSIDCLIAILPMGRPVDLFIVAAKLAVSAKPAETESWKFLSIIGWLFSLIPSSRTLVVALNLSICYSGSSAIFIS